LSENFTNDEGGLSQEKTTAATPADSTAVNETPDTVSENTGANETHDAPSIDELQQMIMNQMEADEAAQNDYFDDFESAENFAQDNHPHHFTVNTGEPLENQYYDISACEKKYVVSINPDIVPMFDKMTPEKRTELVNKLISEHIEAQKHTPEEVRIKKLITHSLVVFVTIAVGFPAIFFLTNASIEATVNSYRQIQGNFEKLYQQKGGIKRKDLTKIQNLQY